MSRIGTKPVTIPSGVTVTIADDQVMITGPKGELRVLILPGITVQVENDQISVSRADNEPQTRANHGLIRSLINNQVQGVTSGYKKTLKLIGTGYRATMKGQGLSLTVGYSHPVVVPAVKGVSFTLEGNDTIFIEGIDKQLVGQVAANIRKIKPPEPYKGKGIRYIDEEVIRKQGKAAAK